MRNSSDGAVSNAPDTAKEKSHVLGYILRLKQHRQLLCLISLSLALHLSVVAYLNRLICDEAYYVYDANSIVHRLPLVDSVQPGLGKLFIAAGTIVFGDNPWGWRMPAVVFGVAGLIPFYMICRKMAGKRVAFIASLLLIFESLTFLISGLAMLDVFAVTLALMSFLFYLRDRYVLAGAFVALAGACKLVGLFALLVMLGYSCYSWVASGYADGHKLDKKCQPRNVVLLVATTVLAFLPLIAVTDFAATSQWSNPLHRVLEMAGRLNITKEQLLDAPTGQQGQFIPRDPWEWILSPKGDAYVSGATKVYVVMNPTIWISIVPSMGFALWKAIRNRSSLAVFSLLWFCCTFGIWLIVALLFGTGMYYYYMYLSVGALCMATGFALHRAWAKSDKTKTDMTKYLLRMGVAFYVTVHVLCFLALSPVLRALASY